MFTVPQLICHLLGDFVLQSDWMATEKTKRSWPAAIHALTYSTPFLFLDISLLAWIGIVVPHFFIDRFRLVRYVIYAKNFVLAPASTRKPWAECKDTGYHQSRPPWLATWLMIIVDNIAHIICNGIVLRYL